MKNKYIILILMLSLMIIPLSSAQGLINLDNSISIYQGNLTNLSELQDIDISSPQDNQVLAYSSTLNKWIAKTVTNVFCYITGIDENNNDNNLLITNSTGALGYDNEVFNEKVTDLITSYNGIYAGMYLYNSSGQEISFDTQNEWVNYTNLNCGLLNGFTCDGTTGTLTALYNGIYSVETMSNGEDGNNQIFEFGVAINNVIQNDTLSSDETTSGIRTSMDGLGRIELESGDKINLQIRDTTGTTTGTLYHANMIIDRVGN